MSKSGGTDLRKFFQKFSRARLRLPAASGNRYEFFTFLNVCAEAQRCGFRVKMHAPGGTYIVRASPGALGGNFGHANLHSPSAATYELHNGIEIDGQSGMLHEADLLLIAAQGTAPVGPPRSALQGQSLHWTAECKLYGSASRLKGESRKAVGASMDWSCSAHPSRSNGRLQGCLHCGTGFSACFVTNVRQGLRPDIEDFLGAYELAPCFGMLPLSRGLGDFRSHVCSVLSNLP
jgi:hypothetical protein